MAGQPPGGQPAAAVAGAVAAAAQSQHHLCVVRLSARSQAEIQTIDAMNSSSRPIQITITCKQVPDAAAPGDIVLFWLGSDNNKGQRTTWKQGFRAVGKIASINRTGGFNDDTHLTLDVDVVFDQSISKEEMVDAVGAGYSRLAGFPVLGLSNYSSQVVQIVDTQNSREDPSEFFRGVLNATGNGSAALLPKLAPLLAKVNVSQPAITTAPTTTKPDAKDLYSGEKFVAETGESEATANDWLHRLQRKKQVVLVGPPGSGKTWIAQRLALLFADAGGGVVRVIQFHPSYSYEDFIGGIRPETSTAGALTYSPTWGVFLKFCDLADKMGGAPAVLVIDELNRADLSRVFGEVMMLLDYRNMSVTLPGLSADEEFKIPDNLYIVGTMNSADRSIALFDHAMRRRFSFIEIAPNYDLLRKRIDEAGGDPVPLMNAIEALNKEIHDPDYFIGISFFIGEVAKLDAELPGIWDGEILPYVKEHFFGRPDVVARFTWVNVKREFFDSHAAAVQQQQQAQPPQQQPQNP